LWGRGKRAGNGVHKGRRLLPWAYKRCHEYKYLQSRHLCELAGQHSYHEDVVQVAFDSDRDAYQDK
jgi:hypothetical protein